MDNKKMPNKKIEIKKPIKQSDGKIYENKTQGYKVNKRGKIEFKR